MYGLVPYNISPIQQGIQFGHAVVEYGLIYGDTDEYQKWAREDKTFIILNGGTTNTNPEARGSLNQYAGSIEILGIRKALFHEPDLGDQLTAVVFLVDDRVFDKEAWPNYAGEDTESYLYNPTEYWHWKMKFSENEAEADKIVFLRDFLKSFKLA